MKSTSFMDRRKACRLTRSASRTNLHMLFDTVGLAVLSQVAMERRHASGVPYELLDCECGHWYLREGLHSFRAKYFLPTKRSMSALLYIWFNSYCKYASIYVPKRVNPFQCQDYACLSHCRFPLPIGICLGWLHHCQSYCSRAQHTSLNSS